MKYFHLIVVTLVILFAADISMKIFRSRLSVAVPHRSPEIPARSENREMKPFSVYSKIAERNLFQNSSVSPQEESHEEESMEHPVTTLKLALKGTVVGNPRRSFAVIEDEKLHSQKLYHIDDTISSGVTLSAIFNDRVVINRNGQKELLLMFQEDQGKNRKSSGRPVPARRTRTIQRQEIRAAVSDLRTLMRDVRIIPHFTAGKRDGFTVTYVRQGSRLEELGLQKKDIIREINGEPAAEFRNIFEIFNKYADADSLDLGVDRDNQRITITYSIE